MTNKTVNKGDGAASEKQEAVVLKSFYFPDHGRTIQGKDLADATDKLEKQLAKGQEVEQAQA